MEFEVLTIVAAATFAGAGVAVSLFYRLWSGEWPSPRNGRNLDSRIRGIDVRLAHLEGQVDTVLSVLGHEPARDREPDA